MHIRPHPYWVRSDVHGLSHALENMPPTCFLPSLCSGQAFKSVHLPEKADCVSSRLFLAGALGLEPRVYGFGGGKTSGEKSFVY